MSDNAVQDRASGTIMGAFIVDGLDLGPHWFYNLAELRRLAAELAAKVERP